MPKGGKGRDLPFQFDEANDSLGFLLWQVTALWQRQIAAVLRPHGLTHVQFVLMAGLLWMTATEEHVTQIKLAKHTKADTMTTSQVLRALETRGYVERQPHPHDTRARTLHLTAAGRALVAKAVPAVEGVDARFFAVMSGSRKELGRTLQQLIAAADQPS